MRGGCRITVIIYRNQPLGCKRLYIEILGFGREFHFQLGCHEGVRLMEKR